jgi:hypothetical protein
VNDSRAERARGPARAGARPAFLRMLVQEEGDLRTGLNRLIHT